MTEPEPRAPAQTGVGKLLGAERFSFADAIGGWRGLVESSLPGFVYVVAFLITDEWKRRSSLLLSWWQSWSRSGSSSAAPSPSPCRASSASRSAPCGRGARETRSNYFAPGVWIIRRLSRRAVDFHGGAVARCWRRDGFGARNGHRSGGRKATSFGVRCGERRCSRRCSLCGIAVQLAACCSRVRPRRLAP